MAIAGSTAEPTYGDAWYGLNVQNQFASGITLPAGGPWRIYRIGAWMAGYGETARTRLCLWDASNNLQRQSAEFTAANRTLGDPANYEQNITDYEVAGGTTVLVGFHTHSDDNRQFAFNSSGTRKEKTTGDTPSSMASSTLVTGSLGVWLYYELANSLPTAPTLTSPANGAIVNDLTPDLDWTHNDPDGDVQSARQLQVDNNSDFSSPLWDSTLTTSATIQTYGGSALSRGTTYYWRVRTKDAVGYGPWSSARNFKIASLPTTSVTSPSADGVAAPLYYTAGSDTTPKFRIGWSFSCPDGGTQSSAIIRIYDTGGVLLHTHNHSGSATTADLSGYAPTNGSFYRVSAQVTCSHGAQSTETANASRDMRARWGRASYRADLGATPLTLSATVSSTANSGQVIVEYGSTTGTTPEPTDWKATIAEVTKRRYVWHRATLMPQAVAAPTSPTVNQVLISYSANVLTPDDWVLSGVALVDLGTFVYGTQSIRHTEDGTGNAHETYQIVPCVAGTDYIFSGRIKTQADPGAFLQVFDAGSNELLAGVSATADTDWTRYATPVFNSGAATSLKVRLRTGSLDAASIAWFDALKLEASKVVTPWTPGFLGEAVVLDAGGLMVDAAAGGVFRLRTGDGDAIRLTDDGLEMDDNWIAPTFSGTWANYDVTPGWSHAGYRKDASGFVHLRGLVKDGTANSTIFTLPVGYRPAQQEMFIVPASGGPARLRVNVAGTVYTDAATGFVSANAYVSLSGIKFKAEN